MLGNIIVGAIVLVIAALAAWKIIKDRKKGGSCNCGCEGCGSDSACHPKKH